MEHKNISCIIVDDEPLSVSLLESYITKCEDTTLFEKFTNPVEALHFLEKTKPNLVFLDVQMPELSGIQFMKILQKKCFVVLTTAYPEYAVNAFDLDVIDYLLKPFTYDRYLQAIKKVKEKLVATSLTNQPIEAADFFYIKSDRKMIKIFYEQILYLEALRDYVAVHTKDGKMLTLQSMRSFEETLPNHKFIRVHKSYIINTGAITSIETNTVSLDKIKIPIGSVYAQNMKSCKH